MAGTNLISEVTKLQELVNTLSGTMSDKFTSYSRELNDLTSTVAELQTQLNKARLGSTLIGEIKFLPYPKTNLPEYYYFCGNILFDIDSPQGQALLNLNEDLKNILAIVRNGNQINTPNFFSSDGRGYFVRSVDGVTRAVGSIEDDQMRAITGNLVAFDGVGIIRSDRNPPALTGAFRKGDSDIGYVVNYVTASGRSAVFDSSLLGDNYNGTDTHPLNIDLTPTIFLGV